MEFGFGLIFIIFLCLAWLPAIIAASKGYNFFLWLLVNILVGWTVIGWIICLFVAITREPTAKARGMRECPKCMAPVKQAATVCNKCGNEIGAHIGGSKKAKIEK